MGQKTLVSWSSGKDSAYALHVLRNKGDIEVVGLLTTVNEPAARVAMHAVRLELLELQAERLGLSLWCIDLPYPCSNEEYEARMLKAVEKARREGIVNIAFGDLFLEDIRAYRERHLENTGIRPLFPLWHMDTRALAEQMLDAGVVAHLTTVDLERLPCHFAGRRWDRQLLRELPASVDVCGENGEFHSFVSDGPGFARPISVSAGELVERDGFCYRDLLPGAD